MIDFPRDDLIRMVELPESQVEFRSDDDGRLMIGIPIVFNTWTEIGGWEGNFLERVAPSSVTKTLAQSGDRVKVLFNHGFDPQIGDKPLGKPSVMEPRRGGLYTETPLARTSYNDDLIELMKSGAIDGMSFRFSVTKEEVAHPKEASDHNPTLLPERTIKEMRLYEFGPVTFPAYEATTVGVRAREGFNMWRTAQTILVPKDRVSDIPEDISDPAPLEALVGAHRKRVEQTIRRLARSFPELKETS